MVTATSPVIRIPVAFASGLVNKLNRHWAAGTRLPQGTRPKRVCVWALAAEVTTLQSLHNLLIHVATIPPPGT